jgi:uncharacterized membrane protein
MKKFNVKEITKFACIIAIYWALTMVMYNFSYVPIQVRVSEILVLLCFFNKKYYLPLVLGCLISNFFSPYGLYDIIFGTLATAIALLGVCYSKNIFVAALYPVLVNGLIIGFEITFLEVGFQLEVFLFNSLMVAAGEFISVFILGIPIFMLLRKNRTFMELVDANQNINFE